MTSDRIEDLLRGDVPARDPAARERARVRLRAAMALAETPARRRSRWLAYAAAPSVAAVLLLLLQLMLPVGPGGLRLSAAAEVRQLGMLSSQQTSLQIGASDYLYRREEQLGPVGNQAVGVGTPYTLQIHAIAESWIASDGSGRIRTSYRSVDFASDQDRRAWEAAGSPPLPPIGEPVEEDYPSGRLPFYSVEALPTEPSALEQALDEGKVIATAAGDANQLSTIGTLLAQGNASPDLRRALFEVAAEIPRVEVNQQAVDPIGRAAISVSVADASGETSLYFDPIDASLLASIRSHPADSGSAGPAWHVYLESGVVSSLEGQPSS